MFSLPLHMLKLIPCIHTTLSLSAILTIFPSTYLSLYISFSLHIFLSTYLSLYISFSIYIFLPIYLSVYISLSLSDHLFLYRSFLLSLTIFLSIYLSLSLWPSLSHWSFSLYVFLYIYLSVYKSFSLSEHLTLQSPYTFLTLSDIFLNILYNVHLSHSLSIHTYIFLTFWIQYLYLSPLILLLFHYTVHIQYTCRSFSVTVIINLNYKRHTTKKPFQLKQISEHL